MKRTMSLTNVVLLGVSAQIGSGWLFAVLGVAGKTGASAVLSWIIAAALFGIIAVPWMELGTMLPRAGGPIRYPSLSHGMLTGWLAGWAYWIAAVATTTLEAQAVLTYLSSQWPGLGLMVTQDGVKILSWPVGILSGIAVLGVFMVLNMFGVALLSEANRWITIWKIAIPTITFLLLFTAFNSSNFTDYGFFSTGFSGLLQAIPASGIAFAFLGFRNVLDFGGEIKNPRRNIPLAIAGAIIIPLIVYVLLQAAFVGALDWKAAGVAAGDWGSLLSSDWASAPLFQALVTAGFGAFGTILLIDAVASPAATGWVFLGSSSRSTLALSDNGMMPSAFKKFNRFGTPWVALAVSFGVACLFLFPLPSWYKLVSVVSVALLLSYLIGATSMTVFRKTAPHIERPFFLRRAGFWAPASYVVTMLVVYVVGFPTLVNLMTIVFIALPMYAIYTGPRAGWMNRGAGWAWSLVFAVAFFGVNKIGGWFMTLDDKQRPGSIDTLTYLALYTAVIGIGIATLYLLSTAEGRQHIKGSVWFAATLCGLLFLSYFGGFGPLKTPALPDAIAYPLLCAGALASYYWSVASGFRPSYLDGALADFEEDEVLEGEGRAAV
jgi:amino acid transporter